MEGNSLLQLESDVTEKFLQEEDDEVMELLRRLSRRSKPRGWYTRDA